MDGRLQNMLRARKQISVYVFAVFNTKTNCFYSSTKRRDFVSHLQNNPFKYDWKRKNIKYLAELLDDVKICYSIMSCKTNYSKLKCAFE